MKTIEVRTVLAQVTRFKSESQRFNIRVDGIGSDLDEALALLALDLRGQSDTGRFGIPRIIFDWVTGVIVKLAGGLKLEGGDKQDHERHFQNARRWILDSRPWETFARSLESVIFSDQSTLVSQSTGLAVLQAAIFATHNAQSDEGDDETVWVPYSIATLCGLSSASLPRGVPRSQARESEGVGDNGKVKVRIAGTGAASPLRVSLDVYVTFLVEAMQGHVSLITQRKTSRGSAISRLRISEEVITLLLRFHIGVQRQQVNQRKVFSACCLKIMGPLFKIIGAHETAMDMAQSDAADGVISNLQSPDSGRAVLSVATAVLWDALFHEEHLEGYRSLFVVPSVGGGGADADQTSTDVAASKAKKRRYSRGSNSAFNGSRRACYQQEFLEQLGRLVGRTEG
ncbi:unnamed protein product, partial [Choristocarpus tenellus]